MVYNVKHQIITCTKDLLQGFTVFAPSLEDIRSPTLKTWLDESSINWISTELSTKYNYLSV